MGTERRTEQGSAQLGLDRARVVVTAAAPVPSEVHEFIAGLGIPLVGGWGLTEIGTVGRLKLMR